MAEERNSKKRPFEDPSSPDSTETEEEDEVVEVNSNGTGTSQSLNQGFPRPYIQRGSPIYIPKIPPQFVQLGMTFAEQEIRMKSSVMGRVLSVIGPQEFWLIRNKDLGLRTHLAKKMTDTYRDEGLNERSQVKQGLLVPGLIVACCFERTWVRGRIITPWSPNFFKVFLVDYGIDFNLGVSYVRYLIPEFLSLPILALECELALTPKLPDIPTRNPKTPNFCRDQLAGKRAMKSFTDLVFPGVMVSIKFFPPAPIGDPMSSQANTTWAVGLKVTTRGIHPCDYRTVSVANEMILNQWYAHISQRHIRPKEDEEGFCSSNE